MGEQFRFECEKCSYVAEVSGGKSAGMLVGTTTIICRECCELYDVVTEVYRVGERFQTCELTCPKQDESDRPHEISAWQAPGLCPKCNHSMRNVGLVELWD